MTAGEFLDVLDQRRRYLEQRVQAKRTVGWDYAYDQRERDALAWAVGCLSEALAPVVTEGCPHPEERRIISHNMGEEPQFWCPECKTFVKGAA